MNRQNKCKSERDRGSKNYVSISNPKESKDSGVIYRLWKNGRDIDLQKQTWREINLGYEFWLKYMLLVKQPRKCCGMDNLKYEEKSDIEMKISKLSSQKMLETMGIEKRMTSI